MKEQMYEQLQRRHMNVVMKFQHTTAYSMLTFKGQIST